MAMSLASMNPMVGSGSRSSNIMINSICPEKDAQWGEYSISKTLDSNDNRITVDDNGKVCLKDKKGLEESFVSVYYILSDNSDEVLEELVEEAMLPYEDRPVHSKSYLFEKFTGHEMFIPEQAKYEPLLEEIELDKFSRIISSDAYNLQNQYKTEKERVSKKDTNYSPDYKGYPIMNEVTNGKIHKLLSDKGIPNYITVFEDANGYYGYNIRTNKRTYSSRDINDILFETIVQGE